VMDGRNPGYRIRGRGGMERWWRSGLFLHLNTFARNTPCNAFDSHTTLSTYLVQVNIRSFLFVLLPGKLLIAHTKRHQRDLQDP
jgi:hypothetical protein